jgi:hypothetical protein
VPNLPTIKVYVSGQLVGGLIRGLDLDMAFNEHSFAFLDILYTGPFSSTVKIPTYAEQSPIVIVYGVVPYLETFYGYVNHHELLKDTGHTTKTTVRYGLIGTTQPMNSQHTRSWKNVSAAYIAKEIATSVGLRSVTSQTNRVLDYWSQAGESDIKLLVELANESGFRFWADGGTLYFTDPETFLTGPTLGNVPTFIHNKSQGSPDTLVDFVPVTGQNVPGQGIQANRMIHGVDSRTGQPFKYSTQANLDSGVPSSNTQPYITKVTTHQYVRNYGQAKSVLDATASANRDWVQAKATVIGTPRLRPGSLVNLTGRALPDVSAGLWEVIGARHVIIPSLIGSGTTALLSSVLSLSRNNLDKVTFNTTKSLSAIGETVGCSLSDNLWRANSLTSYVV